MPNTEAPVSPAATAPAAGRQPVVTLLWTGTDENAQRLAQRGILLCKAGQAIAHKVPPSDSLPQAGIPVDVFRPGKTVAWGEALGAYVAQQDGHARFRGPVLQVEDTLELPDDLDSTLGSVAFGGDIVVRRNVLDLAELRGGRDITIQGCVEAASVCAARDITIHHGVCGKEKGLVQAGKCLSARFLTNARVVAGGDVVIENVSDNSHIQCGGELRVDRGTILSGHAVAGAGIHCHTAGSQSGAKTILELGVSPAERAEIQRLADQVAAGRQRAAEIRDKVNPLMARQKMLTAAQKEKATELLYTADELEQKAAELARDLERRQQPLAKALQGTMHVASTLYAGVLIRFPAVQALVTTFLRGPLTISLCTQGGRQVVVCTDDYRGTRTFLSADQNSVP